MNNSTRSAASAGFGIGNILALVISYGVNHSILWAIIHGILGWIYVLYYLMFIR